MSQQLCKDRLHFRQHYSLDRRKIFCVYCGHCTIGKAKQKKPDAQACDRFTPCPPQEDAFVTKEHLSKELLQYVLKLELLPEIQDCAE